MNIETLKCEIRFHDPNTGKKTTIRLDTGEILKTEDMTDEEMQEKLFEENLIEKS